MARAAAETLRRLDRQSGVNAVSRALRADWTIRILGIAVLLVAWLVMSRLMGQLLMPSPSRTLEAFVDLVRSGQLVDAWLETLIILGLGLGAITVLGITLGIVLGRFRTADTFLDPVLTSLFIMPKLALLPIVVLWLGFQESAKVVYIILFGVFEVLFIVRNGVRAMESDYVEVARSFSIPERMMLTSIVLPAAVPFVITGLRLGLLKGIEGAIIAGFFLESNGIGGLIYNAGATFRPEILFAGLATVALVGVSTNAILHAVERHVAPWTVEQPS